MSEWSPGDFVVLCYQKGIFKKHPSWRGYLDAILEDLAHADLCAENAKKVWKDLLDSVWPSDNLLRDKRRFECETRVYDYIHALHSIADKLGQVVNVVVLDGYFEEGEVSFSKVVKRLGETGVAPQVKDRMDKFASNDEFRYIDAFCNTVKHRRQVGWSYHEVYREGRWERIDMKFPAFEYRGDKYPEVWAGDVLEYRRRIRGLLADVGLSLNEFVKNMPS